MSGSAKQPTLKQLSLRHRNHTTLHLIIERARRLGGQVVRKPGASLALCEIQESGYHSLVKEFGAAHVLVEKLPLDGFSWQEFYQLLIPYEYSVSGANCEAELKIGDRTIKGRVNITFNKEGVAEHYVFNPS